MSREFKKDKYSVKFTAIHQKKIPYCFMYIKLNTSEKDLLLSLNMKFKLEKLNQNAINPNNSIINCIIGTNGIVVGCIENKITSIIAQYINYLTKTNVKPKQLYGSKGNYKKLEESLFKFEVYIIGKCKNFIKNNIDASGESSKIKMLFKQLSSRVIKDRTVVENPKYDSSKMPAVQYNCSKSQLVDVIASYKDAAIVANYTNAQLKVGIVSCASCPCWKLYSDALKGYLKTFKSQCGSYGTPSDDAKWKAKRDTIFKSINMISFMITDVRNVKSEYQNPDDLKQVDSMSVQLICNPIQL